MHVRVRRLMMVLGSTSIVEASLHSPWGGAKRGARVPPSDIRRYRDALRMGTAFFAGRERGLTGGGVALVARPRGRFARRHAAALLPTLERAALHAQLEQRSLVQALLGLEVVVAGQIVHVDGELARHTDERVARANA